MRLYVFTLVPRYHLFLVLNVFHIDFSNHFPCIHFFVTLKISSVSLMAVSRKDISELIYLLSFFYYVSLFVLRIFFTFILCIDTQSDTLTLFISLFLSLSVAAGVVLQ